MMTRNKHKAEIAEICKSGPKSSHITPPKPNPIKQEIDRLYSDVNKIREEIKLSSDNSTEKYSELNSLCEKLSDNFQGMLKRLNLDAGNGGNPIHIHSANKTPELQDLFATAHIVDVAGLININPSTWATPYSHYECLAMVLGGTGMAGVDYIEEIIQLPPVIERGQTRYAVNLKYSSCLKRQLAVNKLKEICHEKNISVPVHFSLWKYPILKKNVTALSCILKDMQTKGEIEWYSLNNFMAVNHMEYIAPMFTVKIPGVEQPTEYRSCPTNSLYHSGFYISLDGKNSETNDEFQYLKNTIQEFVEEIRNNNKSMTAAIEGRSWADIVVNSGRDGEKGVVKSPPVIDSTERQDLSQDRKILTENHRNNKRLTNQQYTPTIPTSTPKSTNNVKNWENSRRGADRSYYSNRPIMTSPPARTLFPYPPPHFQTTNHQNKNNYIHRTPNSWPNNNSPNVSPFNLFEQSLLNPQFSPNYNIFTPLRVLQAVTQNPNFGR